MGYHVHKAPDNTCVIWKAEQHGDTAETCRTRIPVTYHREAQVHIVRGFVSRDPKVAMRAAQSCMKKAKAGRVWRWPAF